MPTTLNKPIKEELSQRVEMVGEHGNEPLAVAASLVVYDAGNWSEQGRKDIARWLRRQAKFLTEHGSDYAPKFRARYMYPAKDRPKSKLAAKCGGAARGSR